MYQAYFAYMKLGLKLTWIWLTFSAVMISTPERLTKVMITCWIDQRPKKKTSCIYLLVTEIVPYGTMPYSVPWWIPSKWKRRRLARTCHTQSSPTGVSSVLGFFKFHFLNQDSFPQQLWWVLTDRDEMVNRLPRIFTPFKRGGKSAKSKSFGQIRQIWVHSWSSPNETADTHQCAEPELSSKRREIDNFMNVRRKKSRENQMVLQFSECELCAS